MGVTAAALIPAAPAAPPPPSLRILQVNSVLTGGGTDESCVRLAQVLRAMGRHVWVAGPGGSGFDAALGPAGLFCDPALRRSKPRFILHVARCIRARRPDIVHAHHGRDYWPAIFAVWLSGRPAKIILSRHLAKSPGSWASRQFLLSRCDAMVAVSDFVAKVLREGAYEPASPEPERRARAPMRGDKSKIFTAHGGIDTEQFRPMDSADLRAAWKAGARDFLFAVAGSYDKPRGKGQRDFLLAASRIHRQIPDARFLLIGRGSLAETLQEDIVKLGLRDKAWLTPYCPDMPRAMNAIDCLVHPAVGTEAFGLVICEALACGRTVIAAALDGIPQALIAAESAALVPPGSVEKLAEAMLSRARQERWDLARRSQLHDKVAARFSLAAAGDRMCRIYRQVAGWRNQGIALVFIPIMAILLSVKLRVAMVLATAIVALASIQGAMALTDAAGGDANPYAVISDRNVFHLNPPPIIAPPEEKPVEVPKVYFSGFLKMGNTTRVLFSMPATAKDPKAVTKYFSLAPGERDDPLELVKMDPDKGEVEIINTGRAMTLTLKSNSIVAAAAPNPAAAGAPPMGHRPVPTPTAMPTAGTSPAPGRNSAVIAGGTQSESSYASPVVAGGGSSGSTSSFSSSSAVVSGGAPAYVPTSPVAAPANSVAGQLANALTTPSTGYQMPVSTVPPAPRSVQAANILVHEAAGGPPAPPGIEDGPE